MRANCILTLASGFLLAQCSSRTPAITPAYIAPVAPYQSYTCAQLGQEAAALSAKATELAAAQGQNQTRWSVPFLRGDTQTATTRLTQINGQLKAIEQVRDQKKCG